MSEGLAHSPTPVNSPVGGAHPAEGFFPETMWSMISGVRHPSEEMGLLALGRLARAYWHPLYVFVRQRGSGHEDASDAVQGFFAHLLTKEMLQGVERRETRFRTFLLRCFQNWLNSSRRRAEAEKRGGGVLVVPLEETDSAFGLMPPGNEETPEVAFDRQWAKTVFERAQQRLGQEIASRERADYLREVRQRVFHPGSEGPNWAEVAERFGMTEGAVRKAAADLRGRFAILLRQEVGAVVGAESEVDEELRYLFQLLSRS